MYLTRFVIILLMVLAFLDPAASEEKKNENKFKEMPAYDYAGGGFDANAFRTTEEMMDSPAVNNPKEEISNVVESVTAALREKAPYEDRMIWFSIDNLNAYRTSPAVQQGIADWSLLLSKKIAASPSSAPQNTTIEAKAAYLKKDFPSAIDLYLSILEKFPGDLDCHNNLALVLMHSGHDLSAQLELESIVKANPVYTPALINLTVLYERMGLHQKARNLSEQLAFEKKDVPMIAFNEAWYLNAEKKYNEAEKLLAPMKDLKESGKYRVFHKANEMLSAGAGRKKAGSPPLVKPQATSDRDFWQTGMVGKFNWWSSTSAKTISVGVFLLLSLALCGGCIAVSEKYNLRAGVISFLAAGSLFYIIYWGIPGGWQWAILIVYLVIGAGTAGQNQRKQTP